MSDQRCGNDSKSRVYFSVFTCCNRPMRRSCTKFCNSATARPRGRTRGATRHVATTRAREARNAPQSHRALTGRHSRVSRDGASSAPPRLHRRDSPAAQETVGGGEHFLEGAIAAGVGRRRGTREIAPNPRIRVQPDVYNAPRRLPHRNPRSSPRSTRAHPPIRRRLSSSSTSQPPATPSSRASTWMRLARPPRLSRLP